VATFAAADRKLRPGFFFSSRGKHFSDPSTPSFSVGLNFLAEASLGCGNPSIGVGADSFFFLPASCKAVEFGSPVSVNSALLWKGELNLLSPGRRFSCAGDGSPPNIDPSPTTLSLPRQAKDGRDPPGKGEHRPYHDIAPLSDTELTRYPVFLGARQMRRSF